MKQFRVQNLDINFLEKSTALAQGELDLKRLWFVPCGFIVESWMAEDRYSWYMKFSNGSLMQGGWSITTNITITLPVAFADSNWTLVLGNSGMITNRADSTYTRFSQGGVKTPTSFFMRLSTSATTQNWGLGWMAHGRVAS